MLYLTCRASFFYLFAVLFIVKFIFLDYLSKNYYIARYYTFLNLYKL